MNQRRLLVTGAGGQLSEALECLTAGDDSCVFASRDELDITDPRAVRAAITSAPCDWVINAAAYTAVDASESCPDVAFSVNADGPRILAEECHAAGIRLAHVSTDFVFDGESSRPYLASDAPRPLSIYGRSKLAGEEEVDKILAGDGLVVRTSWLYGGVEGNFVATMLRLMGSRDEISVVSDQFGTPTWSATLASRLLKLVEAGERGVHHITDSGSATWYDFAVSIRDIALDSGLIVSRPLVHPISTEDYPTPAVRPRFSVLDKTRTDQVLGGCAPHWRTSLERCLSSWSGNERIRNKNGA